MASGRPVPHTAGTHRLEHAAAIHVGSEPAESAKRRIGRLFLLVRRVIVPAGGVRLPEFDHAVRNWLAIAVQ